jgi:16S rRNA (guanine527-N7)-methyltransferase
MDARTGGEGALSHPLFEHIPQETLERLSIFEALLKKWQRVINLVGDSSLNEVWIRHFADSLQVSNAAPQARRWVDLGSGAGFPGMVTAIKYADDQRAAIHLIESDQRKCAFLREVSRETGAPAIIHCARIENVLPTLDMPIDAVSARALAPLDVLLGYSQRFIENGAVGVFSKGQQAEAELTDSSAAANYWVETLPSQTSAAARILVVRRRRPGASVTPQDPGL